MKRFYLVTPFLFTLATIFFMGAGVSTLVTPDQVFRLLLVLSIFLVLMMFPAYLLTRDWEWTFLLLTLFVFGFYFSEFFFFVVGTIALAAFVLWQAVFRVRGFNIQLVQFFVLLNGVALFAIGLALYLYLQPFVKIPWQSYFRSVRDARYYSLRLVSPPAKPDIYYIVLDGYLRSDMLSTLYGFDNSPFTTYLQEKGFIIPDDVHSNYAKTAVSVSSTLNMDYIDSFAPDLRDSHFWWLMEPFIDHSRVKSILESQGYRAVSFSTGWSLTDNPSTDIYLHPFPVILTDYERYFLRRTALGYLQPLLKDIASIPTFDTHRTIILHSFESLKRIPSIDGPKFIVAHIPSPHPPFVFDKNGGTLIPSGSFNISDANDFDGSESDYRSGYVGQVEFVNSQMKQVIDAILKESKTPPIILIQADHGSGLLTDFSSAENTCIKERFSPFAAYYLPGISPEEIPQNLTTVNLFRIVFNHYFKASLPLLKNETYYYRDTVYIYRRVNVTSRLDDECVIR
jgi:hypothetical protein